MAEFASDPGGLVNDNRRLAQQRLPNASQSKLICETVNGSHHYTIKGYSLAKGMGPGKYMTSDTFSVGGYEWAVYFYPDGKNPEDNSLYVSVFIALASDGADVRALFELTLLDQSGKGKHKVHSHFDRAPESVPYTLKYRGSMWYDPNSILCISSWISLCFALMELEGRKRRVVNDSREKKIYLKIRGKHVQEVDDLFILFGWA